MADSDTEASALRHELYEIDVAMDSARTREDAERLVELANEREALISQLQALLPRDADLGVQRNEDRDYDKAAFVDAPILIQGDASEHG